MSTEDVKEEIESLFDFVNSEEFFPCPLHSRLEEEHDLDTSYLNTINREEFSTHPDKHICGSDEEILHQITKNKDVPYSLMEASLKLFGKSIVEYYDSDNNEGCFQYYPSIILTFWSGFETFVRYYSELMDLTVKDDEIPKVVSDFLLEKENYIKNSGKIGERTRYHSVLDRYNVLIKYGYELSLDKSMIFWQRLKEAQKLRDYYTHLDVNECKPISTESLLEYMESLLLGIIWPSCELGKTIFLDVYPLYFIWAELKELSVSYTEKPFFADWNINMHAFHCNFENIDTSRFPSINDSKKR